MTPASLVFIGTVRSGPRGRFLALQPQYREGLLGLTGFSHAVVLWWAHQAASTQSRSRLVISRPYRNSPDDVGVFGSRAPGRPNPVAVSVVQVDGVDKDHGRVSVSYIDAEPGTPLIDIKPYFPASDRVRHAVVPEWCRHWPDCLEASAPFDWSGEFE